MNKIEHLRLIQEVIGRLSGYSNTIKSWTVSLITLALTIGFSVNGGSQLKIAVVLAIGIAAVFFALDLYYLMLEKSYRNLFDIVRKLKEEEIDFRMSFNGDESKSNPKYPNLKVSPFIGLKSPSIFLLYIPIIIGGIAALFFI